MRVVEFMARKRPGLVGMPVTAVVAALLGPIALARICFDFLCRTFNRLASEKGFRAWQRARALRRMSRRSGDGDEDETDTQLPEEYIRQGIGRTIHGPTVAVGRRVGTGVGAAAPCGA